jgi:hypothetical protein
MATQREQVLAYLRSQSTAVDDDQLADALGVRRQTINVICRALAHKGDVMRYYDGHRHKLVNRLPNLGENVQRATKLDVQAVIVATNPRIGSFLVLESADAVDMFAYPGNIDLSEDIVKAAVKSALERDGWTTDVRFGRLHGIDINATRGNERIILEAKGEGSLDAMRVNYFLGALGELLQRMDSPSARYGLALPAHRQFTRLIARLPDWVCQRLGLCFYLVRPTTEGIEVGYVPPRTLHTGD